MKYTSASNFLSNERSDDIISYHASIFSRVLYNQKERTTIKHQGLLFWDSITTAFGMPQTQTNYESVPPFTQHACGAGSGWELRMVEGISKKLFKLCDKHRQNETGGILIGICSYKTKSIHVFDIIQAPHDSIATPTSW